MHDLAPPGLLPGDILTRAEAAKALTEHGYPITANTLQTYVTRGGGPQHRILDRRAMYLWSDVIAWRDTRIAETPAQAERQAEDELPTPMPPVRIRTVALSIDQIGDEWSEVAVNTLEFADKYRQQLVWAWHLSADDRQLLMGAAAANGEMTTVQERNEQGMMRLLARRVPARVRSRFAEPCRRRTAPDR